jgi:hypothetical protein
VNPLRAAASTAGVIVALVALFVVITNEGTPADQALAVAWLATPLVVAGAILAYRLAARARGADLPERLLNLATAGSEEWDRAMRAELASIDGPRERRRFALGCLLTTVRVGTGRAQWVIAVTTGIVLALATLVISRAQFASGTGIIGFTIYGPVLLLFVVSFVTARRAGSFRSGLFTGGLAMVSTLLLVFIVALVEAGRWWELGGVYVMDGDPPRLPIDRVDAMLNAISPFFMIFHLLMWAPWPVLGAAAGWSKGRRRQDGALPATTAGV